MDTLTKAPAFDDAELELLAEALQRLRGAKVEAHATLAALRDVGWRTLR